VLKNRTLSRIFGPKREEVIGGWGKLHNEGLHKLHSWSNTIRIIKSMRMRWTWLVALWGINECM
jgi:hypothetical protein